MILCGDYAQLFKTLCSNFNPNWMIRGTPGLARLQRVNQTIVDLQG